MDATTFDIAKHVSDYGVIAILAYGCWIACKTLYAQHIKSQEKLVEGYDSIVKQLSHVVEGNSVAIRELRDASLRNNAILELLSKRLDSMDAAGEFSNPAATGIFKQDKRLTDTPIPS